MKLESPCYDEFLRELVHFFTLYWRQHPTRVVFEWQDCQGETRAVSVPIPPRALDGFQPCITPPVEPAVPAPLTPASIPASRLPPESLSPRRHTPDFRKVWWDGEEHVLTPTQAAIVTKLWELWEQGTPEVGQQYLLESVNSDTTRLRELFRNSSAWGNLIVPLGKGMVRLGEPE